MPDIKKFYERYLLAAAGLIAVVVAVLLALASGAEKEASTPPTTTPKNEPFTADAALATLQTDSEAMTGRRSWQENTNNASPLVCRVYLLKDDRLVDILEAGNDLFPGIPNKWILENSLDYLDAGLPERDPDEDGFTNLEEFLARTNPNDKSSKPEEWTKLRLQNVKIEHLQIIFTGRDYKGRAAINSVAATEGDLKRGLVGPTKYYNLGDIIMVSKYRPGYAVKTEDAPTPFKLADFKTVQRENPTTSEVDTIQVAILESTTGDGTKVELEANKAQTSPYSLATIIDTRPGGQTFEVRTGESFQLNESGKYKLIDVSQEKATIENLATKETHSIPKATPAQTGSITSPENQTQ